MNDPSGFWLWTMRAAFVGLALTILLGNILPLQTVPRAWAGPDLLFLFAMVWSVRRPEYVPIPVLAAVFLLADFLLARPPGLAAALMLMACFDMQRRSTMLRDAGFLAEWARAAFLLLLVAVIQRGILTIMLVDTPSLGLVGSQLLLSALFYPVAVSVSAIFFGVRLSAPGDLDSMGQRR